MLGDSINNSSERNSIELDFGEKQDAELCRVATIDIGTNSTHLLIAKIERKLNTFSTVSYTHLTLPTIYSV